MTYTWQKGFKTLPIYETADNICCSEFGYKITIARQHCTDMGSSHTHQIQNCCPLNNQKSFRIFCCFAQLHRETIAVHELVLASLIYSQKGTMEGLIGRLLLNPLTPVPPVTGRDECRHLFHSKLDLICTRVLGGNILCSDTQIIVIGLMAAEIYRKNAQKFEWKSRSKKFPATTLHGKNCPTRWYFSAGILELEASPVEATEYSKGKKGKEKKKKQFNSLKS